MEVEKVKSIIEAILFAAGRQVSVKELMLTLEMAQEDIESIIAAMQEDYKNEKRGIEIIKVDDSYQLCTKKELYNYIYPVLDKRSKPNLSNAALETLSIIAYNPKITRAEIESIRGVSADACIYKLLEYGLIEESGKSDLPGKPMTYITTNEFLRMFGYSSLNDLPELPRYKLDSNQQIVIDDLVPNTDDEQNNELEENTEKSEKDNGKMETNIDEQNNLEENKNIENCIKENQGNKEEGNKNEVK